MLIKEAVEYGCKVPAFLPFPVCMCLSFLSLGLCVGMEKKEMLVQTVLSFYSSFSLACQSFMSPSPGKLCHNMVYIYIQKIVLSVIPL